MKILVTKGPQNLFIVEKIVFLVTILSVPSLRSSNSISKHPVFLIKCSKGLSNNWAELAKEVYAVTRTLDFVTVATHYEDVALASAVAAAAKRIRKFSLFPKNRALGAKYTDGELGEKGGMCGVSKYATICAISILICECCGCSAVGGGARVHLTRGPRFEFRNQTNQVLHVFSPASVNWCYICLKRTKHWLVRWITTTNRCINHIHIQIYSQYPV